METDEHAKAHSLFEARARKCEALAAANPKRYRRRVLGLALLGYLFPLAVIALLVGGFAVAAWLFLADAEIGGNLIFAKVGIALLFLIFMVARAMFICFGGPEGIRIRKSDAPDLFALLSDVSRAVGGAKVHRVYMTDEVNAAIMQNPRLGLFGWHRNYLLIGLPFMQTLSREEFIAVLAHEFAHIAGADGKAGVWIGRSRVTTFRILESLETRGYIGSSLLTRFYRWYAPYFAAYSFALAREQEYAAERLAASVTSAKDVVASAVRGHVAADYYNHHFWAEIWDGAKDNPEAPENVYARLGERMSTIADWSGSEEAFKKTTEIETGYDDTHPSPADVARDLGVRLAIPTEAKNPAIDLMPKSGNSIVAEFSRQWIKQAGENWKLRYAEYQEQKQQLSELDQSAKEGALDLNDAVAWGCLTEEFQSPEAALARFEQALEWSPKSAALRFARGRILLELEREEGLEELNRAIDLDADATVPACQHIEAYLARNDRAAEADPYRAKREAAELILDEDEGERTRAHRNDIFHAAEIDALTLHEVLRVIAAFRRKGIKKAWLVRKETSHRRDVPAYLLVCDATWSKHMSDRALRRLQNDLADAISVHLDLATFVLESGDNWLRKKVKAVEGARIFPVPKHLDGTLSREDFPKRRLRPAALAVPVAVLLLAALAVFGGPQPNALRTQLADILPLPEFLRGPTKLTWVGLLRDGEFQTLTEKLEGLHADHVRGNTDWRTVERAFDAFEFADPELQKQLDRWTAASPDSFAPRTARGIYHFHLAHIVRGSRLARETSPAALQAHRDHAAKAIENFSEASRLNGRAFVPYAMWLIALRAFGSKEERDRVYRTALENVPDASAVHRAYFFALDPRWQWARGPADHARNLERFLEFGREAHRRSATDPTYRPTTRALQVIDLRALVNRRKFQEAVAAYDAMIDREAAPDLLVGRSRVLYALGRYKEALDDALRSTRVDPDYVAGYVVTSDIYKAAKRYDDAEAHLAEALKRDPANPVLVLRKATLMSYQGRHEQVLDVLDTALVYGQWNAEVHAGRARMLSNEKRLHDASYAYRKAIKLAPNDANLFVEYVNLMVRNRNCEAMDLLPRMFAMCEKPGRCNPDRVMVTRANLPWLLKVCEKPPASEADVLTR